MPNVLLLSAGYGEGHNAAARGLASAFDELGVSSEIADLFALTGGAMYGYSRRGYLRLINHAPHVWSAIYRCLDRAPVVKWTMPLMGRMQRALARILDEKKPDAVVSVYPVYGYLIERLFPEPTSRRFAFHTIVTDSITINSVWHRCQSDLFFVPNDESARVMAKAGVPEERLRILGFPVPPLFARDRPVRPAPAADQPPRVLYMINGGAGQAPEIVSRLLGLDPLHLTVATGRDDKLRARIEKIAADAGKSVELHGWTPRMPELLMTHHILIGKAGGATVQEATAARTPMIITQIVPGQEEGNARLLIENGCGALCETAEAVAAKIEHLFTEEAAEWRRWEGAITRLSRPDAAVQIAGAILDGVKSRQQQGMGGDAVASVR